MHRITRTVYVVLAILLAVSLTSCARMPQLAKPSRDPDAEPVEVTGLCTAELVNGGQAVRVSGSCNLMDGTNGIVSVLNANGSTIAKQKFTKESDDLTFEFPVDDKWPQTVYGFISFDTQQCDKQPDEVTKAYGKKFQNLDGPDVIWDAKGLVAVFQSEALEIPAAAV